MRRPRWVRAVAWLALAAWLLPAFGLTLLLVAWALGTPVWDW